MKQLAILLSGRGSNFLAIADAIESGTIPARISVVISNRESAPGLAAARGRGLEAVALPSRGLARDAYDRLLLTELLRHPIDLICLAGYMRLLTAEVVAAYPKRILNIHPSLLPAFPGLDAQRQALDYGVKITGCTVHFVTEEMDAGPIVLQAAVAVEAGDTIDSLSARILEAEHRVYPAAIRQVLASSC